MLRIYGASDDLVEIEGDHNDEFEEGDVIIIGQREASAGVSAYGVQVRMTYGLAKWNTGATWAADIAPMDDGAEMPWPVTVGLAERGYSALVEVACPKGTPVLVLRKGKHVWRDGKWLTKGDE
jgi:hypothetical protein